MASVSHATGPRAPRRREPGARALAPAGRLFYYTDLSLTALVIAGVSAAFSKYLESEGCQVAAAAADGRQPVYVPAHFPCGRPTLHQMAWLLGHPSAAFLLSPSLTHRCWFFVAGVLTPLIWLLSCILVSAVSPSISTDYGIRLRSAFYPLIRNVPKAMALAQLIAQGPIHTVVHINTQRSPAVVLLHVLAASMGCHYNSLLNLPVFFIFSLVDLMISLCIRYLLSMHGHATWTIAFVATNVFTYLGIPLLLTACMLGWQRRSRRQRRLNGSDGNGTSSGNGTGLSATAVMAAKVEGKVTAVPSLCSTGTSGEASGAGHQQSDQQQQQQPGSRPAEGKTLAKAKVLGGSTSEDAGRGSGAAAESQDPGAAASFHFGAVTGRVTAPPLPRTGSAAAIAEEESFQLFASAGSLREADKQERQQPHEKAPAADDASRSIASSVGGFDDEATAPNGGGGGGDGCSHIGDTTVALASGGGVDDGAAATSGGGNRTTALSGPSLLAAAAAAVVANNRARGGNGGAIPFDDPEKWASVILVRQILAQPVAEYQPMFTRQRISIKVGPCTCSSAYRPSQIGSCHTRMDGIGSCLVVDEVSIPHLLNDACPYADPRVRARAACSRLEGCCRGSV